MSLQLPFGIEVLNQKPADAKYFLSGETPYNSIGEANFSLPSGIRHQGLTVNILGIEYWYKDGITDLDLVVKTGGADVANVGGGTGEIFSGTSGTTLLLRTLVQSGATTIETVNNEIRIFSAPNAVRDVTIVSVGIDYSATTSSDYIGLVNSVKTVYLPASPIIGQQITISDEQGNANTLPITILGNGILIDGSTSASVNTDYGSITLLYSGNIWKVISFSN